MRLPNGDRAIVDMVKLHHYCLSLEHPQGRYKARVFASAVAMTADDAEQLRQALLNAARTCDARPIRRDEYGQRYLLDFVLHGPAGEANVRSVWMVRHGESFPRLITCYVL